MAGIRKLRGKYYARLFIPQASGERAREKLIALGTGSKVIARHRKKEVADVEDGIKAGKEYSFSWESESCELEHKRLRMSDAIKRYLKARKGDGLRSGTIGIYRTALSDFQNTIGKGLPVERIRLKHIEQFKTKFVDSLEISSMNIKLRSIKTFLIWLRDNGLIKSVPRIKMLNAGKSLPIFITNGQFDDILKALKTLVTNGGWTHYAQAFRFYRDTGCRLSEPFLGTLNGDFLTINADTAKGHYQRDIHLTHEQKQILLEMRANVDRKIELKRTNKRQGSTAATAIKHYSRIFQFACKEAGIKGRKFHSLRHTAAVRLYLQTRDIYLVMKQLGHSSVTTTEIYSKFDIKRLQQDFPDLVAQDAIQSMEEKARELMKSGVSDTDLTDTGERAFA